MTKENHVFLLLRAANRVQRKLDNALSCTKGISFSEYQLLRQLSHMHGQSATRVDLAHAVNLTPSAVTRALKPLEKLGIVITEKSDRDARRSMASLTEAGRELVQDANAIFADAVEDLPFPDEKDTQWAQPLKDLINPGG